MSPLCYQRWELSMVAVTSRWNNPESLCLWILAGGGLEATVRKGYCLPVSAWVSSWDHLVGICKKQDAGLDGFLVWSCRLVLMFCWLVCLESLLGCLPQDFYVSYLIHLSVLSGDLFNACSCLRTWGFYALRFVQLFPVIRAISNLGPISWGESHYCVTSACFSSKDS